MDEMLKKYLMEKHGLNVDTLRPTSDEPTQQESVFPEAKPVSEILSEQKPDVAEEQIKVLDEKETVAPAQTEQLNRTLNDQDNGKKQEAAATMVSDPVAYVKEKYKLHPDVSYDELKKTQRKASIMEDISDFDAAVGQLGSEAALDAKKAGYDVSQYKGGALKKLAERERKQFDDRLKFQTDEQDRLSKGISTEKSGLELAKGRNEFDELLKDQKELDNPSGFLAQIMTDTARELYGQNAVPEGTPPRSLLKILPKLSDFAKLKYEKGLEAQRASSELSKQKELEKFKTDEDIRKQTALAKSKPSKVEEKKQEKLIEKELEIPDQVAATQQKLEQLDTTIKMFEDYSRTTPGGTGKLETLGGLTSLVNPKADQVKNMFSKIQMDSLVSMFAGMSKAIDSNSERAAFTATQPDLGNQDATNAQILQGMKSIALKNKADLAAKQKWVQAGNSLDTYVSPVIGKVTTVLDKAGNMKLIPKDKLDVAKQKGFLTVDEYADFFQKDRAK